MKATKDKIKAILLTAADASVRFEVLEKYLDYMDTPDDAIFLMDLLKNDADPCVRHKAAAQLFRVQEKDSTVTANLKQQIIEALLNCALNDTSTVARHESIEALGYLGDKGTLERLAILTTDANPDVASTARIALGTARRRSEHSLEPNQVGEFLVDRWPTIDVARS